MFSPKSKYYSNVAHNFCVTYTNRHEKFNMKSFHYHNVHELYYFISGERTLFFKDRIYHITPGDIVIIKNHEIHSISDYNFPGHSRIMIDFKNEFLANFPSDEYDYLKCFDLDVIVISPNIKHQEQIYNKFKDILDEYNTQNDGKTFLLKIQLINLLILLSRLQQIYGDKKEHYSETQTVIGDIMKYINNNYTKKIYLENIADYMGYSKNYLCSYFKKNTGFSIIEYLNGIRIKKAQEYLSTTELSITDISMNCGFESITHFGRVFKKITGFSPLKYRKYNTNIESA